MKIKKLISVMLMTVLLCVACGQKEEAVTNSTNEDVTVDTPTGGSTADSADETEEIQEQKESVDEADEVEDDEIEYEEVIGDVDEVEYEEVEGDFDADYANITMDDMVPNVIGVDLPLRTSGIIDPLTIDALGIDGLTALFPSAYYVTGYVEKGTEVFDLDSGTNFTFSAYVVNQEYKESATYDTYDYGKFVVETRSRSEDQVSIAVNIYNIEAGTQLRIELNGYMESEVGKQTIAEYGDAFIADILAQVEAASK